jgi:hypothetical protein
VAVGTPQRGTAPQAGAGQYFIGIGAVAVFGVVGLRMLMLGDPGSEIGTLLGLMAWFSFGMALLTILVMLPRPGRR